MQRTQERKKEREEKQRKKESTSRPIISYKPIERSYLIHPNPLEDQTSPPLLKYKDKTALIFSKTPLEQAYSSYKSRWLAKEIGWGIQAFKPPPHQYWRLATSPKTPKKRSNSCGRQKQIQTFPPSTISKNNKLILATALYLIHRHPVPSLISTVARMSDTTFCLALSRNHRCLSPSDVLITPGGMAWWWRNCLEYSLLRG